MPSESEIDCEHPDTAREIKLTGKLVDEVLELCNENVFGCYQCGTCAAGCPFIEEMDLTPDEVIRHVILDKKEVLNSKTIWLCSTCFICAERCPRDINITVLMEALRQILLRLSIDETEITSLSEEEKRKIPQMAFVSLFRKNIG
ncbi:MAG: 4Fe-4S dicluster domain-containing protein [Candidatus Thermoplasmatota archaeon]|nr:4Fe-4S dicluster domain-containing protein [Candidatus Thermoplasmatota archaeon]MBU4144751.1 4Fe-4S dicluster domain-containing protein [Candidatus Thermoplasmatota archaeon]MBU4591495.1 4Fe-4S dicluster domain-containing protein [Candidatus Thermoplasmatota archaeon]